MTRLPRWLAVAAMLAVPAGCSSIDLFSAPKREIPHETGPLTVPPHMKDGAHQ